MWSIKQGLFVLGSAVIIAGCGGNGDTGPTLPELNFTGEYAGKIRFFDPNVAGSYIDSTSVTITIVQGTGSLDLTGNWATPYSSGGLLGTADWGEGPMQLTYQQTAPCTGEFTGYAGVGVVDGGIQHLSGQYAGDDCNGHVKASFDVFPVN